MHQFAEAHPGPSQVSKINLFARIVDVFKFFQGKMWLPENSGASQRFSTPERTRSGSGVQFVQTGISIFPNGLNVGKCGSHAMKSDVQKLLSASDTSKPLAQMNTIPYCERNLNSNSTTTTGRGIHLCDATYSKCLFEVPFLGITLVKNSGNFFHFVEIFSRKNDLNSLLKRNLSF